MNHKQEGNLIHFNDHHRKVIKGIRSFRKDFHVIRDSS